MTLEMLQPEKRSAILALAARHGARYDRVFGSVVRRESSPTIDIDFLVDLEPGVHMKDSRLYLIHMRD